MGTVERDLCGLLAHAIYQQSVHPVMSWAFLDHRRRTSANNVSQLYPRPHYGPALQEAIGSNTLACDNLQVFHAKHDRLAGIRSSCRSWRGTSSTDLRPSGLCNPEPSMLHL